MDTNKTLISIEVSKAYDVPVIEISITAPGVNQTIEVAGEAYVHVKDVPVIREDEMETVCTVGEALLAFGGE